MRVCGIIAEYDPFHKGHLWHMARAREQTGAEYVVCVLGTAFAQRGAPYCFSTSARTRMALENGADVVLQLPVSFSMADAERFAWGGVYILNALGCVTHLSFGAESDNLKALEGAAQCLEEEPPMFKRQLLEGLKDGLSHVQARGRALNAVLGTDAPLAAPNNTLAICYLRMLRRLQSPMLPVPILRVGAYHGGLSGFSSATMAREMCAHRDYPALRDALPEPSYQIVREALETGSLCAPDALDQALLYRLKTMDARALRALPGMAEGLENRVLQALPLSVSKEQLLSLIKTKRYTYTRLSRALCAALLRFEKDSLPPAPACARLLGFQTRALPLLKMLSASGFPLISKNADAKALLQADAFAEALWALGAGCPDTFYQQSPVIIKSEE